MKHLLDSGRIWPPAGFESATPWSDVGSTNRSATRTQININCLGKFSNWEKLEISRALNFWKNVINKERKRNKPIKHLEIRGWTSDFREITETRMRIYAPVICPHPNYVGGDSVTMVFNHTYNMAEMLGQWLPWAISSLGNRCIRRLETKKAWQCFFACHQRLLVGLWIVKKVMVSAIF